MKTKNSKLSEKKRDQIISQILKVVRKGQTFFLSGHEKPDGDTVGSELAFASLLHRLKKKVDIYNAQPVPPFLRFLPGARLIKTSQNVKGFYDVAVIFECTGPERMGNIIDLHKQAKTVVNIDHHVYHKHYAHINLIDPNASSNSEQLFHVFQKARMPLTQQEATALYVGLVTDTGRFQYGNTDPHSHTIAAHLHQAGISSADICRQIYETRSISALKLMGRALASMRMLYNDRTSLMVLQKDDFQKTKSTLADTEEIINFGLMPPSVQVALLVCEEEKSRIKVSLRGKGSVDVGRIAVSLGGGGHKNAAGCTLSGTVPKISNKVLSQIKAALK